MGHCAEILAVGTELLLGNIANTNAQEIAQSLSGLGIDVFWHTAVGDNPRRLCQAVEVARHRADILVVTGGLGPTYDDVTCASVAQAFGLPLVFHPEILAGIEAFYHGLGQTIPPPNRQQAFLPQGCTVLDNPVGTAPGCVFCAEGTHVVMLPGPPQEMRAVLKNAMPYLRSLCREVIVSRDIMTFGMGESAIDALLHQRMSQMDNPSLATYAKPVEVRLRATAKAATVQAAQAMLDPVVKEVRAALGDVVYGIDVSGLAQVCLQELRQRQLTFATAESCTGGLIARQITALPGASRVYRGGVVSYWTEVKAQVLGVPEDILSRYGAVSRETALAMAQGARHITGADLAVSATGVAGPDPDERNNPVGLVYVALAAPEGEFCRKITAGSLERERIQALAANHAFDLLRRWLLKLPLTL